MDLLSMKHLLKVQEASVEETGSKTSMSVIADDKEFVVVILINYVCPGIPVAVHSNFIVRPMRLRILFH